MPSFDTVTVISKKYVDGETCSTSRLDVKQTDAPGHRRIRDLRDQLYSAPPGG